MPQGEHPTKRARRRAGYTLMEMLLVLSVIVVLGALTVPPLVQMYGDYSLKQAVEAVRTELARTRIRAIDASMAYHFHYEPEGQRFVVVPSEIEPQVAGDSSKAVGEDDRDVELYRSAGILPEGMFFSAADENEEETFERIAEEAFLGLDEANKLAETTWSSPLVFYPDGTAHQEMFRLTDAKEQYVLLRVRALTGAVSISKVGRDASK